MIWTLTRWKWIGCVSGGVEDVPDLSFALARRVRDGGFVETPSVSRQTLVVEPVQVGRAEPLNQAPVLAKVLVELSL